MLLSLFQTFFFLKKNSIVCIFKSYLKLFMNIVQFSSVQPLSGVQLFDTLWTTAPQASPSITNSQNLLKLMSIESVMPSNHLILCCPLFLLPSIFSSIRVFSKESVLPIRWPKYWSFSFSINPSNEYSGLIPFRMDWFDLLAVQGTFRSPLQHHSLKASILWHSTFFMVQLSIIHQCTWRQTRKRGADLPCLPEPACLSAPQLLPWR